MSWVFLCRLHEKFDHLYIHDTLILAMKHGRYRYNRCADMTDPENIGQKHAATQAHTHRAKYKCWVYKFQLPTFCIINYIGQKKKVNKYTKYNYFINYQQLLSLMLLKVKLPTYLSKLISPLNKE